MHQTEYKAWLTNIVSSVEELETSYKRRIDVMNAEYQKDIADLLDAYKNEKLLLNRQITKITQELEQAKAQLTEAMRHFKNERVAHKITKDNLRSTHR
jgi:hypothetical protein